MGGRALGFGRNADQLEGSFFYSGFSVWNVICELGSVNIRGHYFECQTRVMEIKLSQDVASLVEKACNSSNTELLQKYQPLETFGLTPPPSRAPLWLGFEATSPSSPSSRAQAEGAGVVEEGPHVERGADDVEEEHGAG